MGRISITFSYSSRCLKTETVKYINENCFIESLAASKYSMRAQRGIKPASQPQTTCNHTSPGPPHPASSPPRSSETSPPDSCCCSYCISSVSCKWANAHIRWRLAWRLERCLSPRMNPGLNCTGQRQTACRASCG